MIKLENVSKIYYNKGIIATGIAKVTLELKLGEFVVITGESGSGKSTLLNVISGLDSYEEGEMYINGEETSHYTERDFENYRRKYIANIFQNFNLINSYTVYQNVELVLLLNGEKKKNVKGKILDILEQVGLTKFKNTKVSKLSGGQKQRVAIARAIVKDTPIIVADEPTGNLDTQSAEEIIEILKKVAKDKLVVMVTHNIEQIENYATRIIKMHDGRMVNNVELKPITEEVTLKEHEHKNITLANQYRLGIRNTFNIFSKFILLFLVFLFMSLASLTEYAAFQQAEKKSSQSGYSIVFRDLSENRIFLNKQDRTAFAKEDYDNMKNIANVDYIVEDDLFLDRGFSLNRDDMIFYAVALDLNNLRGNVDIGRMPTEKNEIILKISKKHFYITNRLDEVLNKTFSLMNPNDGQASVQDLIIVGIQFNEEDDDYDAKIYMHNEALTNLRTFVNESFSKLKILFNNKYIPHTIKTNEKVKKGTVILDDDLKYQLKNYRIINKPIELSIKNIYYEESLNLKVSKTFTKSNFKKVIGLTNYENNKNTIYINPDDYNFLYMKPSYQSSVFVKDVEQMDATISDLNTLGFQAKKVSDYKINGEENYRQIIKVIKVIVTIGVIIVLFFISYLIVKIILKSRNLYYALLRMLGATTKNVRKILNIELFLNSTLSYLAILSFVYLIKLDWLNFEFAKELIKYLSIKEYVFMYLVVLIITRLISRKFTKKLFKKTTINTYNEEV